MVDVGGDSELAVQGLHVVTAASRMTVRQRMSTIMSVCADYLLPLMTCAISPRKVWEPDQRLNVISLNSKLRTAHTQEAEEGAWMPPHFWSLCLLFCWLAAAAGTAEDAGTKR